jgi:hypothetical protein
MISDFRGKGETETSPLASRSAVPGDSLRSSPSGIVGDGPEDQPISSLTTVASSSPDSVKP